MYSARPFYGLVLIFNFNDDATRPEAEDAVHYAVAKFKIAESNKCPVSNSQSLEAARF